MLEPDEGATATELIVGKGRVVSHYELQRPLGQGGMGVVWKARDLHLKRWVAIKFLPELSRGSAEAESRFLIEAQAAAALDHPSICTVYEIDKAAGNWFLAMAYIEGETLAARIRARRLDITEAAKIASDVAAGLEAAHSRNIVHRDIKSVNIMITPDGRAKILDFGIARVGWSSAITALGSVVGTPAYMSPAQLNGLPLDGRTDLWSLGVVLYESVTGRPPFRDDSRESLRRSILEDTPRPLRELRPGLPDELQQIVTRALSKSVQQGYQNASEFRADLDAFLEHRPLQSSSTTAGFSHPATAPPSAAPPSPFRTTGSATSVVVLPFVNVPPDPETEYFCDGLTDELINVLVRIPELRVISRTSAFALRGKPLDLKFLAEVLKVETAMEGTVRRTGNRLRILVQLLSVRDGFQIWSHRFDSEIQDVFELQDQIASSVAEALKVKLVEQRDTAGAKRYEGNFQAYNLYLQGVYHINQLNPVALPKARSYFEGALQLDPNYAPAHSGMARYYTKSAFYNVSPPREVLPQALISASRALQIDNTLAETHATLGDIILLLEWNWAGAEQEYLEALRLAPNDATLRHPYGMLLTRQGRFNEAYEQVMAALRLDPLSKPLNNTLAYLFYYARQYDRALTLSERTLELDPTFIQMWGCKGLTLLELGEMEQAIACMRKSYEFTRGDPISASFLAYALGVVGHREEAEQLVRGLIEREQRTYTSPAYIAVAHIGLGEVDSAFRWLAKAFELHDPTVTFLGILQTFNPLRSDPRFPELLKRVGLPPTLHPSTLHLHATGESLNFSVMP